MTRRRLAFASVVLVLALVAVWWWRRDAGGGAAVATGAGRASAAAPRPANARLTDFQPASIRGRVVAAASGAPLVGATVSLGQLGLDFGARGRPGGSAEPIVVTSDAAGAFVADGLPPGRWSASAAAAGHQPATVEPILLAAGEAKDGVELRLAVGGSRLTGTVGDIGGGAVEGALVRASRMSEISIGAFFRAPYTARTGADGRYALDLADGDYYLQVNHPDYVREDGQVRLRGPQVKDFTLTPGATVEGVVLTQGEERPVEGALVTPIPAAEGSGFVLSGVAFGGSVTDAEGRFALRGLAAGAIALRAMAPGVASAEPTTVELGIAEQRTGVVLYVERAYSISGTVVAKGSKEPLAGVLVGAYNFSPGAAYVASDPTGDDGAFVIHGVRPGPYSLGGAVDGRVPSFIAENLTVADEDLDGLVIELDAGATLRGRVEPATAASVRLEFAGQIGFGTMLQAASGMLVSGRTADDGTFELRGAPTGPFTLRADAEDGRVAELALDVTGDRDGLVLVLEPRGVVAGVVVDDRGQPVGGAEVRVTRDGEDMRVSVRTPGRVTTGPDGRFEALGLDDGDHLVTVFDGGQLAWAGKKGEAAREPIALKLTAAAPVRDLRLAVESRRDTLRGVVIGPDGRPAVDAWVTATFIPPDGAPPWGARSGDDDDDADDDDDQQRQQMRRGYPSEDPVLTDGTGRFEIRELRQGTYDLRAELPAAGARGDLEGVASGASVTIRLDPQASLTGVVRRVGAPVTSFVLEVEGPVSRREQFANREGRYRVARLRPGEYGVSVVSPSGRTSAKATLATGQEATLDLDLVAYGSVRGVVVDAESGEPLARQRAWASTEEEGDSGGQAMAAVSGQGPRTDEEGRFRVDRLGAGKGRLMIFGEEGFEPVASTEFTLAAGQDLDLGTLRGKAAPSIPEDERGTLGLEARAATWKGRPGRPATGDDPVAAGLTEDDTYLWISAVTEDGPAARAGVAIGDRVTGVNGVAVDAVGPTIAGMLLGDKRIAIGATVVLGLARPGAPPTTATLTAVKR